MTVSTDGKICYGICFEEGVKFPWDNEPWYGDITDWWIYKIHNFEHSFQLYDENGMYIDGVTPSTEKIKKYYDEKRDFEKTISECPVKEVNYCSGDFPMFILATKKSVISAHRGYPVEFDPKCLKAESQVLLDFCKKHGIEHDETPKWWLSSYWG